MPLENSKLDDVQIDSRLLLDQVADKWSILILSQICQGPLRFNSLKKKIPGVSQKALTQTLRRLERNGILEREITSISPIAVEYRITPLGLTLKAPFKALFNWTLKHTVEVREAQAAYDRHHCVNGALGGQVDNLPQPPS
ncbi:winged helix-turn-helix transcriptional regulator [Pseudomonas sp. OVF7]|uniref:winged helix-turn-helix transcriptional regulator n=1 Tax=unclassified Pseudomonas TaxID=196821 RepID=UPI00272CFF8A|nr:helix-turn-helix domain-containing protein [Pseudomonas sp. OVF7]WLD65549.1 helix-turn-helix domain-containing protein [Pseudomonas sp. OVF7]